MKNNFLLFFLFATFSLLAQQSIHDYKYVIVPTKFDFLAQENQYRLNTFTKFNLAQIGFEAFYSNENLPAEILNERCSKLYVNVEERKAFLATELIIVFRDCQNNIVYQSEEGKSKEKEYKLAYQEALERAFKSVSQSGYKYNGKNGGTPANTKPVVSVNTAPVSSAGIDESQEYLFAQPIANGYQLVDKTPKVVLKIYKTSQPDYFTAQSETINGAVIKKNGEWLLEYYKNDQPVTEKLLIKF